MKQTTKYLFALVAITAALCVPETVLADAGLVPFATSITVTNGTTNSTDVASSVPVQWQANAGLQVSFTATAAGTGNARLIIRRSGDGTNFEVTPQYEILVPVTGTTAQIWYTNLGPEYIGSAHSARVYVGNTNAASLTNFSAAFVVKTIKAAP